MGFLFRRRSVRAADRVLLARGPARCVAAVAALAELSRDPEQIPPAWERIELPLVQDLPDCPPATKLALQRALEDCSGACRNRDIARRIMVVRDSLLS